MFDIQKYKSELTDAFIKSSRWNDERRRNDPLNGFGRGEHAGSYTLKTFMPTWFKKWFENKNWHPIGLARNEAAWWSYVNAFGMTGEQFWKSVENQENAS